MSRIRPGRENAADSMLRVLDENPLLDAFVEQDMAARDDKKPRSKATKDNHDVVKRQWAQFAAWYGQKFADKPPLDADIKEGWLYPGLDIVKKFLFFLGATMKGQLDAAPTRSSILTTARRFCGLSYYEAGVRIPTADRQQLFGFIDARDFRELIPLSTRIRVKKVAQHVDLEFIILEAIKNSSKYFQTTRAMVQFIAICLITALTSHRPGGIIESKAYKGSNEGIQYQDLAFMIVPNKHGGHPDPVLLIRFRNFKGNRGQDKDFLDIRITPEPVGNRAMCLFSHVLFLALEDGALEDVSIAREILKPEIAPAHEHRLSIRPEFAKRCVFRQQIVGPDGAYTTHPTNCVRTGVQNYHLRQITTAGGWPILANMYLLRRMAINGLFQRLQRSELNIIAGHRPGSVTTDRYYLTREPVHDLGAVLHNRPENPEVVKTLKASVAASFGADPAAPVRLDLHTRADVMRHPELVVFRQQVTDIETEMQELEEDAADIANDVKKQAEKGEAITAEQQAELNDLEGELLYCRDELGRVQKLHNLAFERECTLRLKELRKEHLAGHSKRQLRGETAEAHVALIDKLKLPREATSSTIVDGSGNMSLAAFAVTTPEKRLYARLCQSNVEDLGEEIIATIDELHNMPERSLVPCHPGESPTNAETCPVCNVDCKRGGETKNVPEHIHKCFHKQNAKALLAAIVAAFPANTSCEWIECPSFGKTFTTRKSFVKHMDAHFNEEETCGWEVDGDEDDDDDNDEKRRCGHELDGLPEQHFARAHGLNVHRNPDPKYCYLCYSWHADETGDGREWEDHLHDHYDERFKPFEDRVDEVPEPSLEGVEIHRDQGFVEFEMGESFNGQRAEFHGAVVGNVVFAPYFCPWCVFDADLPIVVRMKQYIDASKFKDHMNSHHMPKLDEPFTISDCPVPSCGVRVFCDRADFVEHIVVFHRLPLAGSTRATTVRRLLLPKPMPEPAAQPTKVRAFCRGCGNLRADIVRHITTTKKCFSRNEYKLVDENDRVTGGVLSVRNLPAEFSPPAPKQVAKHYCCNCRRAFPHIVDHFQEPRGCPIKKFLVMDMDKKSHERRLAGAANEFEVDAWLTANGIAIPSRQPGASGSRPLPGVAPNHDEDEDEDEAEQSRVKKRVRDEELADDDDDAIPGPSRRKKARVIVDSDDENEVVVPSKRSRVVVGDSDDDEEEERAPRRRRQAKENVVPPSSSQDESPKPSKGKGKQRA